MSVHEKASRVRLLLFDVDGVLTDGAVFVHGDGTESKGFHIRDGAALVWAQRAGLLVGFLSARSSPSTTQRAAQLSIRLVSQGIANKLAGYKDLVREAGVDDATVAYMGDDLHDLPVLARVGLSAAPADAAAPVRERVDWVSSSPGGRGAARELVELVLRAQQRWDEIVQQHESVAGSPRENNVVAGSHSLDLPGRANERSERAAGAEWGEGAPASDGDRGFRGTKSSGK
jgi:3-deoxy-D-manno-octulosonate 8-phosphate phosphatase (KDO 8-P phosphatase)